MCIRDRFEVVQPSDTGIAVVDALRRNEVLAGVYGEKYLLVDFGTDVYKRQVTDFQPCDLFLCFKTARLPPTLHLLCELRLSTCLLYTSRCV